LSIIHGLHFQISQQTKMTTPAPASASTFQPTENTRDRERHTTLLGWHFQEVTHILLLLTFY
jgi:hypothetical protein